MKIRITVILAAIGAVVPFLLFLGKNKPRKALPPPPVAESASVSEQKPPYRLQSGAKDTKSATLTDGSLSPVEPPLSTGEGSPPKVSAGEKKEKPADATIAVARAVDAVKTGQAAAEKAEEIPEGAMKIGLVTGQSKLSPELADLAQKGAIAVAAQKWEEARELYLEMVKQAPDNALAYANLGVAEHQMGNLLAAAGNLRKSLDINPSIAPNWQTLGLIHFERGELELSISYLTRAVHEDPSDARSRLYLSTVVREYGWTDAALTELQRAVETDPKLAEAHYNLAVTYLDSKPPRMELARRHYFSAIDLGAEPSPELESVFAQEK